MAQTQKKGLGRGFDSLLPGNFDQSILVDEHERVQKIAVNKIVPNKHQPRLSFDKQALSELADSIKRHGVLQPVVLTNEDDGSYSLVAGERRWRASKLAGLETIPAIVRTSEELERLEIALVENVQRVDLSAMEQAKSIAGLHDQFNMDYETIAKRLGKASTTVINIARLLNLPTEAQEALNENKITEGHARSILALKDKDKQLELLELIIKNSWSVRQAEQFVTAHKSGVKTSQKAVAKTANTTPQTEKLGQLLKTKVTLKRMAKGGRLEITYKNETDLKRIISKLSGK
jgi:ParB family transcriptional regulator, chromosome partitioning protein